MKDTTTQNDTIDTNTGPQEKTIERKEEPGIAPPKKATTATIRDIALRLAQAAKFKVFPVYAMTPEGRCSCGKADCARPAKHPATAHGVLDASNDPSVVGQWNWTGRNIGVSAEEMLVLDVDGEDGKKSLAKLEKKHGALPATVKAVTGSGGFHFYFRLPAGAQVTNSVKFQPGLDTRTAGGYLIAPPSNHASGGRYTWEVNPNHEMAVAPQWLFDEIAKGKSGKKSKGKATHLKVVDDTDVPSDDAISRAIAGDIIAGAVRKVAGAPEGARNDCLNREAFRVGRIIAAGKLDPAEVEKQLVAAARKAGLSAAEAQATAASGLTAGALCPRELEDDGFSHDDIGNADRLIDRFGDDLLYSAAEGWFVWDGRRWERSSDEKLIALARRVMDEGYGRALEYLDPDDDKGKKMPYWAKWLLKSRSRGRLEAMVHVARSNPKVIAPTDFDTNAMQINCANGSVDLRTGVLRPFDRGDHNTIVIDVPFDPKAKCKRWDKFLLEIMNGDKALVAYLKRCVGYIISGDVSEQCVFIFHGTGANGKSTFINVLLLLLGDYGARGSRFLILQRHGQADDDALLLGELRGKRFVALQEAEEGQRLSESALKEGTGGDRLRGRHLYHDAYTFAPTHKLVMATNHRPLIKAGGYAVLRRLHLLPFEVRFPKEKQDKQLLAKLTKELPGILRWAVEGAVEWQRQGLKPPTSIVEATEQYMDEHDAVGRFIADDFEIAPKGKVAKGLFYHRYKEMMEARGEAPVSSRRLAEDMRSRGYSETKSDGERYWTGLKELDLTFARPTK